MSSSTVCIGVMKSHPRQVNLVWEGTRHARAMPSVPAIGPATCIAWLTVHDVPALDTASPSHLHPAPQHLAGAMRNSEQTRRQLTGQPTEQGSFRAGYCRGTAVKQLIQSSLTELVKTLTRSEHSNVFPKRDFDLDRKGLTGRRRSSITEPILYHEVAKIISGICLIRTKLRILIDLTAEGGCPPRLSADGSLVAVGQIADRHSVVPSTASCPGQRRPRMTEPCPGIRGTAKNRHTFRKTHSL
jgi:hypothetical protein